MSRSNKLPFAQGATALGSTAFSTDNLTSLNHLEGQTAYLPDIDSTGDKKSRRSGADVVVVIVRNVEPNVDGSTTLAAGDAVQWVTGYHGVRVEKADGGADHQIAGFVDEHSSGVKTNDLFYMVVKGPSLVNCKDNGVKSATDTIGTGPSASIYKEGWFAVSANAGAVETDLDGTTGDGTAVDTASGNVVGRFKQNAYTQVANNATLKVLLEVDIR
jgi:hypothetical protein